MRRGTTATLLGALLVCVPLLTGCTDERDAPAPAVPTTSTRAEGAEGTGRPQGARLDEIRRAAASAVEVVLSYDHRTLEADEQAATALMTPAYAEEFRDSFATVREEATEVRGASRAVALDSAVVSATADAVRVLVFVDRTTRSGDVERSVSRIAPVVTLERWGSAWAVSDIATGTTAGKGAPSALEAAAVAHATRTARAYLTLSWETVEQDVVDVQDLVAGELARQYADGAEQLVEAVRARRTVQRPRILAVGLSEARPRRAVALVSAVVTTTHQASGSDPVQEGRRLRLELVREGAGWRATQLAVIG